MRSFRLIFVINAQKAESLGFRLEFVIRLTALYSLSVDDVLHSYDVHKVDTADAASES